MIPATPKRAGRPPNTVIDRLRAKVWYYEVKSKSSLSDYQLGLFFLEKVGRRPKDPQSRSRIFETIRKKGTLPSRGNHHKRDFDLIELVESEPIYKGTAATFHSPYWDLLSNKDMDLRKCHDLVQKTLPRFHLSRADGYGALYFDAYICSQLDRITKIELSIAESRTLLFEQYLSKISPSLEMLTLLGACFREAYLAYELELAVIIKKIYCSALEKFISNKWLEPVRNELQLQGELNLLYPSDANNTKLENCKHEFNNQISEDVIRPICDVKTISEWNSAGREMVAIIQDRLSSEAD